MADANQLYNTQTRLPETLPIEDIPNAIVAGTHAYKSGAQVNVIDPDGNAGSLTSDQLPGAFAQGYKPETPQQGAVREYVEDNKNLAGSAKVALNAFANQATFGVADAVRSRTEDPLDLAKEDALAKDHEVANVIGGVGGFGTSLAYGGPLFDAAGAAGNIAANVVGKRLAAAGIEAGSESLAKKLVANMASKGAQLGVEGAVISAPKAITEAALGDPEAAGESLLYGAGAGSVLGLAGGTMSTALKTLSDKAALAAADGITQDTPKSWFQGVQDSAAAKALGFTKGQIKKLKGGSEEASQIGGDIRNMTTADGKKIISFNSSTDQIAQNLKTLEDETGAKIGNIYKTIDDSGARNFDPAQVNARIDQEMGDFYNSPINKDLTGLFQNLKESVALRGAKGEGPIPLSEAQSLLDEVDRVAYPKNKPSASFNPTDKEVMAQTARRIIRDEITNASEQGAKDLTDKIAQGAAAPLPEGLDSATLKDQLLDANRTYATIQKAQKALDDKLTSEHGNKLFGLTDTIAAGTTATGFGVIPAAGAVFGKKLFEKYGNQALASINVEGILAASQAMKNAAKQFDMIPAAIKSAMSTSRESVVPASIGVLARFTGDDKAPKEKQLQMISDKLGDWTSNTAKSTATVAKQTSPMAALGAPNIATAFNQKMSNAVQYLNQAIPKPDQPDNPFHPHTFQPSDAAMSAFERKLEVVMDPFSVVNRLRDHTLTSDHMEALQAVYPKAYEEMKSRVMNHMMGNKQKIPYSARIKLSLLMGTDIDHSMSPAAVLGYQNTFQTVAASEAKTSAENIHVAERTQSQFQK